MEEIIRNAKKNMYTDTYTYFRDDVFHALVGLNPWKASDGPDGVPPIVLRNCASVLAPCLVKLFQLCLSTSTFPSCWKFAYIQPVPKKGDGSNSLKLPSYCSDLLLI